MARKKIAPTLTWHIQDPFASDTAAFYRDVPAMVRELRALVAVARAADEADILHDGPHAAGSSPRTCAGCRLMRGLRRVSAPGARGEDAT